MRKILIGLLLGGLIWGGYVWSQPGPGPLILVGETDGTPDDVGVYKVKFGAGVVTDNGDGTATIGAASSGGGWTDDGTVVRLTTPGDNVGVGTTGLSTGKLTVKGNGTTTGVNTQWQDSSATAKVTILDNGNVGIGTTNPTQILDVGSKLFFDSTQGQLSIGEVPLSSGSSAVFNASRSGYSIGYISAYSTTAAEGAAQIFAKSHTGTIGTLVRTIDGELLGAFGFQGVDAVPQRREGAAFGSYQLGATSTGVPAYLYFSTNDGSASGSSERVRISPAGNIGLGSTVPQAKLVVQGTGTTTAYNTQWQNSSATPTVTILDNGNVGIGTTSTIRELQIYKNQNASTGLNITNPTTGAASMGVYLTSDQGVEVGQFFKYSSGSSTYKTLVANDLGFYNSTSGNISLLNDFSSGKILLTAGGGSTAHLIVNSTGNIGLGSTVPQAKLVVQGTGTTTAKNVVVQDSAAASKIEILDNGNVGVGTTGAGYKMAVNGTVQMAGLTASGAGDTFVCKDATTNEIKTGVTCAASTKKVKEKIKTLTHGLDWILALRPITFKFKAGYYGGIPSLGFLAEEVNLVSPLLVVSNEEDGIYGVRYDLMTAVLTKAIQELEARVKKLETK